MMNFSDSGRSVSQVFTNFLKRGRLIYGTSAVRTTKGIKVSKRGYLIGVYNATRNYESKWFFVLFVAVSILRKQSGYFIFATSPIRLGKIPFIENTIRDC